MTRKLPRPIWVDWNAENVTTNLKQQQAKLNIKISQLWRIKKNTGKDLKN
jgi:hypothetical protein